MKFAHISDNHRNLPELPKEAEFVVASGDFLPDCPYVGVSPLDMRSKKYQRNWVGGKDKAMAKWLDGRPFIFCAGNHDIFQGLCDVLKHRGVDARDITNSSTELNGIRFAGFPYIPAIFGSWNFEKTDYAMSESLHNFHTNLILPNGMPDVLVFHAPPFGVLDLEDGKHFGNRMLTEYIENNWRHNLPKWLLCGHIHDSHGLAEAFGMKISNAATTVHLLEI